VLGYPASERTRPVRGKLDQPASQLRFGDEERR
jgi:hypothetical protein